MLKNMIENELEEGQGFYTGFHLLPTELASLRQLVEEHWLENIKQIVPYAWQSFSDVGMQNYHQHAELLDHSAAWPKIARILPQKSINIIRSMSFIKTLEEVYGAFEISDEESVGREEIYWRLVRPNQNSDVGPIHADAWFWDLGHGITPPNVKRVKVWIPLFSEPGKNGLRLVPNSHKRQWSYHAEFRDAMIKPQIDLQEADLALESIITVPGQAIVFHDRLLHGGMLNQGQYTRTSIEFTMFVLQGAKP